MDLFYNIITISSSFLFLINLCVNNCKESHPTILTLIVSSILYKYIYIYHQQNKLLLSTITKIDQLCIINVFLFHFVNLNFYLKTIIRLLTLINYKFMYFIFGISLIIVLYQTIIINIFLSLILCITAFISYISYNDYLKNGWNIYNSWLWHYATACLILSVKLSYKIE